MDMALRGLGDSMAARLDRGNVLLPRRWGRPTLDRKCRSGWSGRCRAQGQNSGVPTQEEDRKSQQRRTDGAQYMFHAESGGQVRVSVQENSLKYMVNVEANLPDIFPGESHILLHWGLFRSDSTDWVLLEPNDAPASTKFLGGKNEAMQTPMQQLASCVQTLQLELPLNMAPFYVSFVLCKPACKDSKDMWIKSNSGSNFCVPLGLRTGRPDPLGVTLEADGSANFALYSKNAANVTLCLYGPNDVEPAMEIDLESVTHRTGDVWHVQLPSIEGFISYGYRCRGDETWENGNRFHKRRILLDPYAKFVSPFIPGQEELPSPATALGLLPTNVPTFDWEEESSPCIPLEQVVAYRLDVAGFTSHSSCGLDERLRGTFLGLVEKISHFQSLGVNTIIVRPIFSYDRSQGPYYPFSFFSPMEDYGSGSSSLDASISFKKMVKALHKNGIELILDVVYTHTSEKGDEDPETVSFRGIDNQTYYILDKQKRILQSKFGAANVFNCNHPAVHKVVSVDSFLYYSFLVFQVVDSLRYWVEEYHVDGFCFVNARDLTRGPHGEDLSRPLLLEAITFDPVLASTKLIADPYSPLSSVPEPLKFPHWKRWCECNINFQMDMTSFFRGEQGKQGDLATRICGSADMFADERGPSFSLNHITNAYGFSTLSDSTSNSKTEPNVELQLHNLLVTQFLSRGTPVLNMGDESGLLDDGKAIQFDWQKLASAMHTVNLISSLSLLRSQHESLLQKNKFVSSEMIKWHGATYEEEPLWTDPNSKFLAVTLKDNDTGDLCIAFNARDDVVELTLTEEATWLRIIDTTLPYPETIVLNGAELSSEAGTSNAGASYSVQPFSVVVLRAGKCQELKDQA
ncbi:isoamylase 2, chloroplastic isoform X1 [Selaginella moellendorffii]|uniref:isoamylase 2, chloroplastic isoform X1 n=1 Tax=Selaginella moellendorffii TaxID=88036 RepID=UPI000D1C5D0A|nr:isoamylase 2, chloroplastic isoform X1 [Selaginella moellendorffii]|eukprot:XP_024515414.1 isoamylase 2, chloroplastic isoform X1 [Selaginella moellendorffii]